MNTKLLLDNLRTVYDFPKPGIHFKDVTTLFKIPRASKKWRRSWCVFTKTRASQR